MKGRESGMPDEDRWSSFYDVDCMVDVLGCTRNGNEAVVEFGSGYGTFTLPVASGTSGVVHAFDIEPDLVALLKKKSNAMGLKNIRASVRDFVEAGTGLPSECVDHAMVYNILHIEAPESLLQEAFRILKPGGIASIIHWKPDPSTPRGPSLEIRPTKEKCREWAESTGFEFLDYPDLSSCCEHHYGLLVRRPRSIGRVARSEGLPLWHRRQ